MGMNVINHYWSAENNTKTTNQTQISSKLLRKPFESSCFIKLDGIDSTMRLSVFSIFDDNDTATTADPAQQSSPRCGQQHYPLPVCPVVDETRDRSDTSKILNNSKISKVHGNNLVA